MWILHAKRDAKALLNTDLDHFFFLCLFIFESRYVPYLSFSRQIIWNKCLKFAWKKLKIESWYLDWPGFEHTIYRLQVKCSTYWATSSEEEGLENFQCHSYIECQGFTTEPNPLATCRKFGKMFQYTFIYTFHLSLRLFVT